MLTPERNARNARLHPGYKGRTEEEPGFVFEADLRPLGVLAFCHTDGRVFVDRACFNYPSLMTAIINHETLHQGLSAIGKPWHDHHAIIGRNTPSLTDGRASWAAQAVMLHKVWREFRAWQASRQRRTATMRNPTGTAGVEFGPWRKL